MADYQSSFTGEEIDSLLQKVKDGVQSDYAQNDSTQPDYIKNRPFYSSGYKYEWDGVAADESKKVYGSKNRDYYFYKISDEIMNVSDFVGADIELKSGATTKITESSVRRYENGSFSFILVYGTFPGELIFVCVETGFFETSLGTTGLTPGLWFLQANFNAKVFEKKGEFKQLDNKYIAKATAIDDANSDLPVTAGLLKTELENTVALIDTALSTAIGSGVLE